MPIAGQQGNLTVYSFAGNLQTEAFKDKRLMRLNADSPYLIVRYSLQPVEENDGVTGKSTVDGWWDFCITLQQPTIVYVRRNRLAKVSLKGKKDPGAMRGHSSIAKGENVLFAGEVLFGGDPKVSKELEPGQLKQWTNKSGHYRVGEHLMTGGQWWKAGSKLWEHVEKQTETVVDGAGKRLLPMDKFSPWDGDF